MCTTARRAAPAVTEKTARVTRHLLRACDCRRPVAVVGHDHQLVRAGSQTECHRAVAGVALLLRDGLHLRPVARECGFTDRSYFQRKFKELTGRTPAEWRA